MVCVSRSLKNPNAAPDTNPTNRNTTVTLIILFLYGLMSSFPSGSTSPKISPRTRPRRTVTCLLLVRSLSLKLKQDAKLTHHDHAARPLCLAMRHRVGAAKTDAQLEHVIEQPAGAGDARLVLLNS
jgi:hypothetical protein